MPQETIPSKIEEIMKEISRRCYEDDELGRIIKEKDVKSILEKHLKQSENVVEIKRKGLGYQCPNCKAVGNARPNYCYGCGAKIKWID